jgi:PAS domain S-box-containing protein
MNDKRSFTSRILSNFTPPIFPDDEEKTQLSRVLFYTNFAVLFVNIIIQIILIIPGDTPLLSMVSSVFRIIAGLSVIVLLRKGYVSQSAYVFIGTLWLAFAASSTLTGGVYSLGFRTGFFFLIFVSSLLIGFRAAIVVGIISIVYGLFLAIYFPSTEFLSDIFYRHPIRVWLANAVIFILSMIFIRYSISTIRQSLAKARKELSERLKTERSFRESKQNYYEVFNATNEAIFIEDPATGEILEVNETAVTMYGYGSKAELLAQNIGDLSLNDETFTQIKAMELLKKSMDGEPQQFDWQARKKNGDLFWAEISLRASEIGGRKRILAVVRDTSEKRKTDEALRESEQRLRILSESAFEGIGITSNGIVIESNNQLAAMLEYTREEIIGEDVAEFVAPQSKDFVFQMIVSGKEEPYEHLALTKSGKELWVEVRGKSSTISGKKIRITVMRNIDLQKRQSVIIDQTNQQLRSIIRSASHSSFISVDLNGNITAFNPGAELMLGYRADEMVGKHTPTVFHLASEMEARSKELSALYGYPVNGFDIFVHKARTGEHEEREWTYVRKDGCHVKVSLVVTPVYDDYSTLLGYLGIARDITEQKAAEEKIRISEAKLKSSIELTPNVAIQWYDEQGRVLFWNGASELLYGWTSSEAVGKTLDELIHTKEDAAEFLNIIQEIDRTGKTFGPYESAIQHRNGAEGYVMATTFAIPSENNTKIFVCMDIDITESKKSQKALVESNERFSSAFSNAPLLITISTYDDGKFIEVNNQCYEYSGYHPEEIIGKTATELRWLSKEDRARTIAMLEKNGRIIDLDLDLRKKDGSITNRLFNCEIITINGEKCLLSISLNITDRKLAEKAIRENEEKYTRLFETAGDAIFIMNEDEFIDCNQKTLDLFRCTREQIIGHRPYEFSPTIQPDGRRSKEKALEKIHEALRGESQSFEWTHSRPNGSTFDAEVTLNKFHISTGMQIQAIVRDITERKRSEEQIRLLAHAMKSVRECICIIGLDDSVLYVNEEFKNVYGFAEEEIIGKDIGIIRSQKNTIKAVDVLRKNNYTEAWHGELFHVKKNGAEFPVFVSLSAVRGSDDTPESLIGVMTDLTKIKQGEEEKKKLEDQLLHAQKMDSFGRLAGGIAHDFNNMLTPILGFGEILRKSFADNDPRLNRIHQIIHAAESSRNLVSKLLAFARKQNLDVKRIDLNNVITDFQKILSRTLTENIIIKTHFDEIPLIIHGDAGQIEQIILNLSVNAMHAMPNGGTLIIETKNISINDRILFSDEEKEMELGEYVMLSVSDTGSGIPKEILSKIYEPFFTTKEKGKGTGLGLSTVYGIVKQHRGFISVYSEVDIGTTFKIYFPYYSGDDEKKAAEKTSVSSLSRKRTILVVEDQEQILELIQEVLTDEGFTIFTASSVTDALKVFRSHRDVIDRLITDIILPDGNGRQLFETISAEKPEIRVMFMSSYTEDIISMNNYLPENSLFIPKPFILSAFVEAVQLLNEA